MGFGFGFGVGLVSGVVGMALDLDTALVVARGAVALGEVLGAALACRCLAVAAQEETAETAPEETETAPAVAPVGAVTAAVDEPEVPGKARGWIVRCVSPALL